MEQQKQPQRIDNQPLKKKSRVQIVKELIHPPDPTERIADDFGIMKEVAGLRYLQNIKDLEQRRKEIGVLLTVGTGQTTSRRMEKSLIENTYRLFFLSGSPWYRGLDNRELTKKVAKFLRLYNEVAMLPAFTRDLFMCSMALLHLSFQSIDVTNTPAYVIQTTPLILTPKGGEPRFQSSSDLPRRAAGNRQEETEQPRDNTQE